MSSLIFSVNENEANCDDDEQKERNAQGNGQRCHKGIDGDHGNDGRWFQGAVVKRTPLKFRVKVLTKKQNLKQKKIVK